MSKQYGNIYQIARESTGLTQEKVSEMIDISVESLRRYEASKRTPTDEVVMKMIELYKSPILYYKHFQITPLGEKYLPDIELKDLAQAVLTFLDECEDLEKIKRLMIKISKDNKVDENEQEDWNNVKKEVKDMIIAGMPLMFI